MTILFKNILMIMSLYVLSTTVLIAKDLQSARAAGEVCEGMDGYVRALVNSPEIQALVQDVNRGRHTHYAELAKKTGVTPEAAAKLAAQKLRQEHKACS